jgi:hypothetical protein
MTSSAIKVSIRYNKTDLNRIKRYVVSTILTKLREIYLEEMKHPTTRPDFKLIYTGHSTQSAYLKIGGNELIFNSPAIFFVEYGTDPRTKLPPHDAIERWVRLKLHITGKQELERTTKRIMFSIKKKGTPEFRPIRESIKKLEEYYK